MGIPLETKPCLNQNHPAIGSSMVTASPADSGWGAAVVEAPVFGPRGQGVFVEDHDSFMGT